MTGSSCQISSVLAPPLLAGDGGPLEGKVERTDPVRSGSMVQPVGPFRPGLDRLTRFAVKPG